MRDRGQATRSRGVQEKLRRGQNLIESLAQLPDVTPDALEAGFKAPPIDTDSYGSAHLLLSEFRHSDAHGTKGSVGHSEKRKALISRFAGGGM
jgi:hypothetical protein